MHCGFRLFLRPSSGQTRRCVQEDQNCCNRVLLVGRVGVFFTRGDDDKKHLCRYDDCIRVRITQLRKSQNARCRLHFSCVTLRPLSRCKKAWQIAWATRFACSIVQRLTSSAANGGNLADFFRAPSSIDYQSFLGSLPSRLEFCSALLAVA